MQDEQRQILRKAWRALEAGGITPVLLKGLGLAHYYPHPEERLCGDIDIYVGKEHYHDGARILRETFPDAPCFDLEEEYFKHYNLDIGSTAIEMHRVSAVFQHPKDARVYDALERGGLQQNYVHYVNGEDEWNEPEYKFNVLFVFIHSWQHFLTNSANARQLSDIAYLLSAETCPLEAYLKTNLKKLHLLRAWQLYAYILVNYLGLPKDKCPLYTDACADRAAKVFGAVLHGRKQPKMSDDSAPKNVLLRKLYTFRERVREAREVAAFEPHYARHMVVTAIAQSWVRFTKGENTRQWI